MNAHRELAGQLGRYAILRKLGAGGMGSVYLARDTHDSRTLALKVPHLDRTTRNAVERFRREAHVAAALKHPNLCPVYGLEEIDGVLFISMAYIEGTPLSRMLERGKPWPVSEAVELVRKVAAAVEHLHTNGIIHRDLKPSNVMITPAVEPVLMDFGLALDYTSDETRLTRTGAALGSPPHMAPEQVAMKKRVGPGVDVYGLGLLLYELLTSRLPFEEPTPGLYMQILHDAPPAPSSLNRGVDPRLDAIILKALSKRPEERQPSAAAFAAELAALPSEVLNSRSATTREASQWRMWCPKCGKALRVSEKYLGHKVRCPRCQNRLGRLQGPGAPPRTPVIRDTAARDDSATAEITPGDVTNLLDDSSFGESSRRLQPGTLAVLIGLGVTAFIAVTAILIALSRR